MIVLVILGIVAAITIPALVNRHMEAERRTKLKKAMSVYDTALNKMVIENGIKSDTALVNWADSNTKNDCANTSAYFKVARNLEVNGNATNCKFRASDGVFWDISDIKKPLVALREQDLNDETAQSDTNRAFYMFGWFDENGSLRSNDLGKISATDKAALEKLYDFIAGKTKTSMKNTDPYANYKSECTCSMQDLMVATQTFSSDNCKSCTANMNYEGMDITGIFDEQGRVVYYAYDNIEGKREYYDNGSYKIEEYVDGNLTNYRAETFDKDGHQLEQSWLCDNGICKSSKAYDANGNVLLSTNSTCDINDNCLINSGSLYTYNSDNKKSSFTYFNNCNGNSINSCNSSEYYTYHGNGKTASHYYNCNGDVKNCDHYVTYNEDNLATGYYKNCDSNNDNCNYHYNNSYDNGFITRVDLHDNGNNKTTIYINNGETITKVYDECDETGFNCQKLGEYFYQGNTTSTGYQCNNCECPKTDSRCKQ